MNINLPRAEAALDPHAEHIERREQLADMSALASVLLDHCSTEDTARDIRAVRFGNVRTGYFALEQRRASPGQAQQWRSSMWLHFTPRGSETTHTYNLSPWADHERILPEHVMLDTDASTVEKCAFALRRMGMQHLHQRAAQLLTPMQPVVKARHRGPERRMLLSYGRSQFLLSGPGADNLEQSPLSISIGPQTLFWLEPAGFNLDLRRNQSPSPALTRPDQQITWLLRAVYEGQTPAERAAIASEITKVDQLGELWTDLTNTQGAGEYTDTLPDGTEMVRAGMRITNELFDLDDVDCLVGVLREGTSYQFEIVDMHYFNITRVAVWADVQDGSINGHWRTGDGDWQTFNAEVALGTAIFTVEAFVNALIGGSALSGSRYHARFTHEKLREQD